MDFSFRHLFNICAVLLFLGVVVMASTYNRQAAMMPLFIGIPVLMLAIAQMVVDFRADTQRKKGEKNDDASASNQVGGDADKQFSKEVNVSLWVIGMFISIYIIGFLFTTFLFTLLFLKARCGYNWRISLGIAVGSWAFLYFLMVRLMEVGLYDGAIIIALRKAWLDY